MKHLIKFLFILTLAITLYLVGSIVNITWEQYQDTKDWESISIQGELKDVPPFLAKNYINLQDKEAVETWQEVNQILTDLSKNGQMESENIESYRQVLDRSVNMQETYNITSGTIADQNKQLTLYLDLEDALNKAYDVPEADVLKSLTGQLYSANLNDSSPIQVTYLKRLKATAKDYKEANAFIKETLPELGTLSDGVLMANTNMSEENTDEFINAVKEKKLDRFGFINSLLIRLKGDEWVKVLTHNQMIYDYELWQDAKKKLHGIKASDYILVEDLKTYGDVLDAGLETDAEDRDGYTIDKSSKVLFITYNGETISKDKYIKRGSDAVATIKAEYKKKKEKKKEEKKEEDTVDTKPDIVTTEVTTENGTTENASTETATTETVLPEDTEDRDLPPIVTTVEPSSP